MKVRIGLLLFLAALIGAKTIMPFQSSDVAQLVPVETLVVSVQQGQVVLDSGKSKGLGVTWAAAVQDLRQGAEGTAFLGTAEHIVLCGEAEELLEEVAVSNVLRPAAAVCVCPGDPPKAEDAGKYLAAQKKGVSLQQVHAKLLRGEPVELPVLMQTEGGLRLYGP